MTTPYRSDQRRVMITLPADRYKELKATARANSLPMTAILNALIGDYLKAERNGAADTGAGLADRVEALEKRLAILSAMVNKAPRRRNRRGEPSTDAGEREQPPTGSPKTSNGARIAADLDGEPHADRAAMTMPKQSAGAGPTVQTVAPPTLEADAPTARAESGQTVAPETSTGARIAADPAPTSNAMTMPKQTRGTLDDQHARAADLSKRARVPLASTLAGGETFGGGAMQHSDQRAGETARRERLEETKRRAASYALHGARYNRGAFIIGGAGT